MIDGALANEGPDGVAHISKAGQGNIPLTNKLGVPHFSRFLREVGLFDVHSIHARFKTPRPGSSA